MQNHSIVRMTETEVRRYQEMRAQCNQQLTEVLKALYASAATLHAVNHIAHTGLELNSFEQCDVQSCVNARKVLGKYETVVHLLVKDNDNGHECV